MSTLLGVVLALATAAAPRSSARDSGTVTDCRVGALDPGLPYA